MKYMKAVGQNGITDRTFAKACLATCQKVVVEMKKAKDRLLSEFRDALGVPEQLVRRAVNEAEDLAWQTAYPHLVFPVLAMEKAQAAAISTDREQRAESVPLFRA
jgi:hypothetical protein